MSLTRCASRKRTTYWAVPRTVSDGLPIRIRRSAPTSSTVMSVGAPDGEVTSTPESS